MKHISGTNLYIAVSVHDWINDIHGNPPVNYTILWESVSERIEEVRQYINEWEPGDCLIVRLRFDGCEVERYPEQFVIRGEPDKETPQLLWQEQPQ